MPVSGMRMREKAVPNKIMAKVKSHALMAQGAEEIRPYVKPQTIYKQGQTESFHVVERHRVDAETTVSGQDSNEKNERNAQGDTHYTYFSQSQTERNDGRKHHYCLYR